MADHADLLARLRRTLGPDGLLADPAALRVYRRDASHLTLGTPLAVALPATAQQAAAVVTDCAAAGVPVVGRGAGTGLSGGAVPPDGALVLSTARLRELAEVVVADRTIRVGAGVLNEEVSRRGAAHGLHFAPDPSSQSAATIGGNIAENAGGPHCLRYGVTVQHLRHLEWIDDRGRIRSSGHDLSAARGLDLLPLLCGSEGTLGVITSARLLLTPTTADVATLLAFFPDIADATNAVVRLLGRGLLPVAVEMIDQPMLQAVEEAFAFGFATDVAAAMIVEFAGRAEAVAEDVAAAEDLLGAAGAREVRRAHDADERARLWRCRKKAFGAVGRLAPSYVTMDVVVPLSRLPGLMGEIQEITARHDVHIATAFHAGDGNLHPGVHYDDRDPDETRRAHEAADEIIARALIHGGSVTGEHGVGIEKKHVLAWQLDAESARLQRGIARAFDPRGLLNPGKIWPDDEPTWTSAPPAPATVEVRAADLAATLPAATPLRELQAAALERGLWLAVGWPLVTTGGDSAVADPTVGEVVDRLLWGPALLAGGTARDILLEVWGTTGDGRDFHAGAPVVKNVAGYDLVRFLCGTDGTLARLRGLTFQLRPAPDMVAWWRATPRGLATASRLPDLLTRLRAVLLDRDAGTAGPSLLVERGADGPRGIVAVTTGRDRDWDLGELHRTVERLTTESGWVLVDHERRPLVAWATGEANLWPTGVVSEAGAWTALARKSATDEPAVGDIPVAASGGRDAGPWFWQGRPDLWWTPQAVAPPAGWVADVVLREGRPTPLPPPAIGTPVRLLRGLKRLFDPQLDLATPPWLSGDDDD